MSSTRVVSSHHRVSVGTGSQPTRTWDILGVYAIARISILAPWATSTIYPIASVYELFPSFYPGDSRAPRLAVKTDAHHQLGTSASVLDTSVQLIPSNWNVMDLLNPLAGDAHAGILNC